MVFIDKTPSISDIQKQLLKHLSDNSYSHLKEIMEELEIDRLDAEYNLGELIKYNLATVTMMSSGQAYSITHEGRTILIKNK